MQAPYQKCPYFVPINLPKLLFLLFHFYRLCLFIFLSFPLAAQDDYSGLSGKNLRKRLRDDYRPAYVLSYATARDTLYAAIHARNDTVYCFYTGFGRYLPPGSDPSKALFMDGKPNGINCEHAWPRSKGASKGNGFSDMHHLFPTRVDVNAARSNHPYGDIPDLFTDTWYADDDQWSFPPFWTNMRRYSEVSSDRFEPREQVKGDIARALFYFNTMYPGRADQRFFQTQLNTLLRWNEQDPPDTAEQARTWKIAEYQDGKPNPYVLDPSLAKRAFK